MHAHQGPAGETATLAALAFGSLATGTAICVHLALLTVGRDADATTLPGYDALLPWTWLSVTYALDMGIAGYTLVLPVVTLGIARLFSDTPLTVIPVTVIPLTGTSS